jgi:WD40 repeat protein
LDGRLVASAAVDRTIKLWSLSDARLLRTFDGVHGIEALAFSPDGPVLAAADDNLIALFDVRTGATIRRVAACDDVFAVRMLLSDFGVGEPSRVIALPFNPSGKFLASACDGDASVKAWDFATGREIRR